MRLIKRGKTWYARFYDAAGVRQSVSTRCHDKAAAEAFARTLERDAADPDHASARAATITSALEEMILDCLERSKVGKMAPETVEFYRKRAGHLLRAEKLAVLPSSLRLLRAQHVDAFISLRRTEGVSEHTISKELITLRKALKLAKRRGRFRGDIAEVLPSGFAPEYKPRTRTLSMAELERLLSELAADRGARVAFAVATGANLRETDRALRSDVADDRVHLRGTKRETRDRIVPIVRPWQRELLAYAAEHAQGEGDLLFTPWMKMVRDLALACRRCDIERCSSNDLRRTFATWMRIEGLPTDILGATLGHVDSRMVERVYGRLSPEQLIARVRTALGDGPLSDGPPVGQTPSVSTDPEDPSDSESDRKSLQTGSPWGAACEPLSGAFCGTRRRESHRPAESERPRSLVLERVHPGRLSAFAPSSRAWVPHSRLAALVAFNGASTGSGPTKATSAPTCPLARASGAGADRSARRSGSTRPWGPAANGRFCPKAAIRLDHA